MTAGGLVVSCRRRPAATTQPARTRPARPRRVGGGVWKPGPPYVCRRARGKITIDGKDHPAQWARAAVIEKFFVPVTAQPAKSATRCRMLWDDENHYVRAVAYDVDLRGSLRGPFARLWTEDVVELFLKPPAPHAGAAPASGPVDRGGYYEFEVSPSGALLDLEIPIGRHRGYRRRAAWESGARLAVLARGTIGRPEDTDELYRIVMAIPWKALRFAGGRPPKVGERWRFIFARCDLSQAFADAERPARQEISACVPLPKVDFHDYPHYPEVLFAD